MPPQTETVFLISRFPTALVATDLFSFGFVLIGLAMVFWLPRSNVFDNRAPELRLIGPIFLLIATVVFGGSVFSSVQQWEHFDDFRDGHAEIVSGCLQRFSPSTSEGHTPDVIEVQGKRFEYSDNTEDGGYHVTEISGGYVHADTWVRMFVVR